MKREDLKTSEEWQKLYPNPIVYDPDGWDRRNWQFSWYEERITYTEYQKRLFQSTVIGRIEHDSSQDTQVH